jgi:hypothetical protein
MFSPNITSPTGHSYNMNKQRSMHQVFEQLNKSNLSFETEDITSPTRFYQKQSPMSK